MSRGTVQQFRQGFCDQFVEFPFGRDDVVQSRGEDLTISHGFSVRQLKKDNGRIRAKLQFDKSLYRRPYLSTRGQWEKGSGAALYQAETTLPIAA
ncbi:MAG: hypothetical protein AMXMBFR67_35760 [Nitrospira sp.]